MNRLVGPTLAFTLLVAASALAQDKGSSVRSGWFSDERCAAGRVASGTIGPNNRECVQKCLREGSRMVFVDEKAKALFYVENPATARGQESHYVQVLGEFDEEAKSLRVANVKVLEEYQASCGMPNKKQ
jgi:hypothetical protein